MTHRFILMKRVRFCISCFYIKTTELFLEATLLGWISTVCPCFLCSSVIALLCKQWRHWRRSQEPSLRSSPLMAERWSQGKSRRGAGGHSSFNQRSKTDSRHYQTQTDTTRHYQTLPEGVRRLFRAILHSTHIIKMSLTQKKTRLLYF